MGLEIQGIRLAKHKALQEAKKMSLLICKQNI